MILKDMVSGHSLRTHPHVKSIIRVDHNDLRDIQIRLFVGQHGKPEPQHISLLTVLPEFQHNNVFLLIQSYITKIQNANIVSKIGRIRGITYAKTDRTWYRTTTNPLIC